MLVNMYKATHSYEAQQDHLLSFSAGDTLCLLEKNNESWWLASNNDGKVGYVPRTYIQKQKENSTDVVLKSVNNAIEEIIASAPGGVIEPHQQALLKKLVAHKDSLASGMQKSRSSSSKRRAPPPPLPHIEVATESSIALGESSTNSLPPKTPPAVPKRNSSIKSEPVLNIPESTPEQIKHEIPEELGTELMQIIQTSLNISETKTRNTLNTVFVALKNRIPSLQNVFDEIMKTIPTKNTEEECDKLGLALANLCEIKDDAQQRNWAIGNDEENIMEILDEILTELTTVEKQSCLKMLSRDQHLALHTLVDYHQMETRISLRLKILQIFGVLCSLSNSLVSALLATVLPLEIAMDIMNHTQDTQRICYSALVMCMIFSTAEPIPLGHYGRLNKTFIDYLIKYIEDEIDVSDPDEQVMEMFVNIILSFNQHFMVHSDNSVMQAIGERSTCTSLSEKIMILINRGDDPVAMEENWDSDEDGRPPPSVIKFLQDVFSERATSTFLYTNDMNVLLDIITRNLTDLPSGSKLRTDYLDLLLNILTNTDYSETRHRVSDIGSSLNRILGEEQPDTHKERQILEFDKQIVEKIMNNFGYLFS